MKKKVKAILLDQEHAGWIKGQICKCYMLIPPHTDSHLIGKLVIAKHTYEGFKLGWVGQNLYIVDETLDLFPNCYIISSDNVVRKVLPGGEGHRHMDEAVIVATTEPKLIADGIPPISEEFQIHFVNAQGKGKIMMDIHSRLRHLEDGLSDEVPLSFAPIKTDDSGYVILRIIPNLPDFMLKQREAIEKTCETQANKALVKAKVEAAKILKEQGVLGDNWIVTEDSVSIKSTQSAVNNLEDNAKNWTDYDMLAAYIHGKDNGLQISINDSENVNAVRWLEQYKENKKN